MHSWYACHRENERQQRLDLLAKALKATTDSIPLSSEEIVNLLEQQLKLKGTSKLPVLMIKERIGKPSLFCGRKSQKELLMDWVNMITINN